MSFIFIAKTTDANSIKILAELLQNNIKIGYFKLNKSGIYLRMTNNNRSILVDLELQADRFNLYEFNENKDVHLGINLSHFYKMLKSIKKKDSLVLSIKENSNSLLMKVIPQENSRVTESEIKIQPIQNLEIDLPELYENHINIPSNEFQKTCKEMATVGTIINVTSKKYYINFYCNGGNIYSKNITFGEPEFADETEEYNYNESFDVEQFIRLNKITGLSNNIQVFTEKESPLIFKSMIGDLGNITIYIKSREFLEKEKESE